MMISILTIVMIYNNGMQEASSAIFVATTKGDVQIHPINPLGHSSHRLLKPDQTSRLNPMKC